MKYNLAKAIFLITFYSLTVFPQGLKLQVHIPKDTLKSGQAKSGSFNKYRVKLSLPDTIIEIKNDTLQEKGQDTNKIEVFKNGNNFNKNELELLNLKSSEFGGVFLLDPSTQESSGTSWQPETSNYPALFFSSANWKYRLSGSIFLRYNHQAGLRGGNKFDAPNWFLGSAQTNIGINSQIMFRTMLSFNRLTEGGGGYPLLFQNGGTYKGLPLIDHQVPQNLFEELSASYSYRFTHQFGAYLYLGYPGEPALGPPNFLLRQSAIYFPEAPLGNQMQDAVHTSFGVTTIGLVYHNFKVEGSIFNGSEPDENKFNFDKLQFNSYSGRISYNPTKSLSLQISKGLIKNPEGNGINITRSTASALYTTKLFNNANWASSLIWGENNGNAAGRQESFLYESSLNFKTFALYTRLEFAQRTLGELGIKINSTENDYIGAFTLGINKDLFKTTFLNFSLGIQGTYYGIPNTLKKYYGSSLASYEIYFSIRPFDLL